MNQSVLTLRAPGGALGVSGTYAPQSSECPSAYASEDDEATQVVRKPFRLLDLPSELRLKIYGILFQTIPDVIDLDPDNFRNIYRKLYILYVSRQINAEASHLFYSTSTFRIFPCHSGRFFKTKKPLLARLSPRCRASISSLELRLGPGFASPPKGWAVTETLGLKDAVNVRILKVMVQVDTSNAIFNGFRAKGAEDDFYENFSKDLLEKVLTSVPSIVDVQFDAWPGVQKDGAMLRALLDVANKHKKFISWGPERGWDKEKGKGWADVVMRKTAVMRVLPKIAVVS
jgi:hypothetical protein